MKNLTFIVLLPEGSTIAWPRDAIVSVKVSANTLDEAQEMVHADLAATFKVSMSSILTVMVFPDHIMPIDQADVDDEDFDFISPEEDEAMASKVLGSSNPRHSKYDPRLEAIARGALKPSASAAGLNAVTINPHK